MLKNLTPHTLNIHTGDGVIIIEPSGVVARVTQLSRAASPLISWAAHAGAEPHIPTVRTTYGEVSGLPEFKQGTWLVVSGLVASQSPRGDVFSPGDLVRDEEGRPCGCKGLRRSC